MTLAATRRVKRTYHRNGGVATEETHRGGVLHGRVRRWHRNGALAAEAFYAHGLLHGVCQQWGEDGRVLGSFRMEKGTGVQRAWFDDGALQLEQFFLRGSLTGPSRLWLRDGTLWSERWFLADREVTCRTYAKAAAEHPEWPDCRKAERSRRRMGRQELEAKAFGLHCQWLLARGNNRQAQEWLTSGEGTSRALGRLSRKHAMGLVDRLMRAGAPKVLAVDIYQSKDGKQLADALLVGLPNSRQARLHIRRVFHCLPDRARCAVQPDRDRGAAWLYAHFG